MELLNDDDEEDEDAETSKETLDPVQKLPQEEAC